MSGVAGPPLLRAVAIERRIAGRTVLAVDELVVENGEIVAVLGPNGAGKSTLFRVLLLLERPDAGTIELRGRAVGTRDLAARRRLAGVFQQPHLFAGSVRENVAFALRARAAEGASLAAACDAALVRVGVAHLADRDVATLSGGEAQRVALARAVVCHPDVLLLDEPTAGLDAQARRAFRRDLERAVRTGASAAVLITHDAADAFALADRVVVLEAGRVVQVGAPADLIASPATPFVAEFTGAEIVVDGVVAATHDALVDITLDQGVVLQAVAAMPLAAGTRAHLAYRPEDVLLEPVDAGTTSSARNRVVARVAAITPAGGLIRVRLDGGPGLVALVTAASAEELQLDVGVTVAARIKVSALRAFAVG
jgi:molybdopterin-binding protein